MIVSLIIVSISTTVLQNYFFNTLSKTKLKTASHLKRFNALVYLVGAIMFGTLLTRESISVYTTLWGIVFGLVCALASFYKLCALSEGPMHITLLVTTSSMIIPTLSGIFFGERFSPAKFALVFVLIFFIYLSIQESSSSRINKKWFLFSLLSFIFQGAVGVVQKIHQTSVHKSEISTFLFVAFLCATVFYFFGSREKNKDTKPDKKSIFCGLLCGGFTFTMNFINLKLSGILPSQLFFPLVNGTVIVLSSIMSAIVFKEKLSKRQMSGLVGGIITLIALCLVP